jgi:hypothetical protein
VPARIVELAREPRDGSVLVELGDQVVHDVVTGLLQEHVDREHLTAPRDGAGVDGVADPVTGFGVLVSSRVGEYREDVRRSGGDGAGDDVPLVSGHASGPFDSGP